MAYVARLNEETVQEIADNTISISRYASQAQGNDLNKSDVIIEPFDITTNIMYKIILIIIIGLKKNLKKKLFLKMY